MHNTYGELGNADLLNKYGFALRQNPFSAVILSKASVLQAAEKLVGQRELRLRSRLLRKERYAMNQSSCQHDSLYTAHLSLRTERAYTAYAFWWLAV